ncbi:MAG TPA: hypothetical protein VK937_01585 [Candidatus Limnocylindria bacterium]|nr:hypothetical protein [Candidatus Limnocylindria bacterium]
MATRHRLIKLDGVSKVLVALPPGLAKALIELLTLESLREVRELCPVLQRS